MYPMTDTTLSLSAVAGPSVRKMLAYALWTILGLHTVLLLVVQPDRIAASRICTAAAALLAVLCAVWRTSQLPARARPIWLWSAGGFLLWATAHLVETFLGGSAASNLAVDPSDFIYMIAAFPLLIGLSTTRETESIRTIFFLNCTQIVMAFVLSYHLLYGMARTPEAAATVMGRIYGLDCALLALMAALRLFAWETPEERRTLRTICTFLWTYLPIELAMDYASQHWNLQAGSLIDLLWSVPFALTAWLALTLPTDDTEAIPRKTFLRGRLLVETLCPLLITTGIFALAASITSQHPVLGLSAIFLLLMILGLQSGLLQLNYLAGQAQLLEREQDLQAVNAKLQQLSLLDPLTSIPNRRRFDEALGEAWRRAGRKHESLALLIVDVDHFKGVNDLHGHSYGDKVIVIVAQILHQQAGRPYDLLARYGGDEFLLLLPDTDVNGATAVAERIHASIHHAGVENRASPFQQLLTVSIGVGVLAVSPGVEPGRLLEVTDRALYEAKRLGRNRTSARQS
jgi:diguanylate cyclase (GGDEF)-like protein